MKLRNKKTGEIVEALEVDFCTCVIYLKISKDGRYETRKYDSLAELNEEWEDWEEPKEFYWIDYDGEVKTFITSYEWQEKMKEIGNYFETEEEAKKAVEKLKAWKRLKDKGFRFHGWKNGKEEYPDYVVFSGGEYYGCEKDLDLLFGGEE